MLLGYMNFLLSQNYSKERPRLRNARNYLHSEESALLMTEKNFKKNRLHTETLKTEASTQAGKTDIDLVLIYLWLDTLSHHKYHID